MFRTLARRAVQAAESSIPNKPPLTVYNNRYQTKKIWPPDYEQLTHQEMLRFEKKYKRRLQLATRRPRWDKGIKLAQLATVVGMLAFVFFFSEVELLGEKYRPNERVRYAVRTLGGLFDEENRYKTKPPPMPRKSHKPESESEGETK